MNPVKIDFTSRLHSPCRTTEEDLHRWLLCGGVKLCLRAAHVGQSIIVAWRERVGGYTGDMSVILSCDTTPFNGRTN